MCKLSWLFAGAWLIGCAKTEPRPTHCVYQDVSYSIGATRCAPGLMTPPGYQVFECHDTGQGARWIATSSLCNPPATAGSGSGSAPVGGESPRKSGQTGQTPF